MTQRILAGLAPLLFATPALAAEAAEHGEPNLFAGDVGSMIWTVVIFLVVLFVLGKWAWGPILSGLQRREDFIRESLEKARHEREQAEARLREYEERLAAAHAQATAIVEEGRRDAEVVKRRIEDEAKREYDKSVERAKREIQIATDSATRELYTLASRLAVDMAGKVLGREIGPQDHQRLIAESIEEIGSAEPRH